MERLCMRHVQASEWFESRASVGTKTIERHLSITNRALGSQTSMGHKRSMVKPPELVRKHRRYRRLYRRYGKLYGRALAPELAWSRPYLEMMAELMEQLTLRKRR